MLLTATLRLALKKVAYAVLGENADLRPLQDLINAGKAVINSFVVITMWSLCGIW
jgi:hypothetical protein